MTSPGGELTRTQRKAEKVAKELNLPAVAANKGSMHNRLVVQVCKVTGLEAVGTVGGGIRRVGHSYVRNPDL